MPTLTPGDDIASGTNADDIISGLDGADRISAGGGADVVDGDAGDDLLRGMSGDDRLRGGSADDLLHAGAGAGSGDYVDAGDGADRIYIEFGQVYGRAGDDVVTVSGPSYVAVYGEDGADRIYGSTTSGPDGGILDGGAGDDIIQGRASQYSIHGGDGNDRLFGGVGDDTLFGNGLEDSLYGGEGADVLDGGFGADLLDGGGTSGAADQLTGGAGADTFVFKIGQLETIITDYAYGEDILDLSSFAGHSWSVSDSGAGGRVTFDTGDSLTFTGWDSGSADMFVNEILNGGIPGGGMDGGIPMLPPEEGSHRLSAFSFTHGEWLIAG